MPKDIPFGADPHACMCAHQRCLALATTAARQAPELVSRGRGRGGVRLEKNTGRGGSKRRVRPRPLQRVAPHMRAQAQTILLALLQCTVLLLEGWQLVTCTARTALQLDRSVAI